MFIASSVNTKASLKTNLNLGNKYLFELDYEQAVAYFTSAINIDENCVEAYIGAAKAYDGMENREQVVAILEEGIARTEEETLKALLMQYQAEWDAEAKAAAEAVEKEAQQAENAEKEKFDSIWLNTVDVDWEGHFLNTGLLTFGNGDTEEIKDILFTAIDYELANEIRKKIITNIMVNEEGNKNTDLTIIDDYFNCPECGGKTQCVRWSYNNCGMEENPNYFPSDEANFQDFVYCINCDRVFIFAYDKNQKF